MRTFTLASGSNGNSIFVETEDARLLFDAGLSGVRLARRAATQGLDLDSVDALLLSHNHGDHVSAAGVLHRRHGIPLLASRGTHAAVQHRVGKVRSFGRFKAGESLTFGRTVVTTIKTPHDGRDGVAFVVEHAGSRLGILTDLGHPFPRLVDTLPTLDAAYLEANYDPVLLATGPYPEALKDRIAGDGGHLSNDESVALARDAMGERLSAVMLCHLSGENNDPDRVLEAARPLAEAGLSVDVATRTAASAPLTL